MTIPRPEYPPSREDAKRQHEIAEAVVKERERLEGCIRLMLEAAEAIQYEGLRTMQANIAEKYGVEV